MSDGAVDLTALERKIDGRVWYHTMELAPGLVTPGWFDTRSVAPTLPFPDLRGRRCLDIGTFDGFWAFEMERRGAAEVITADVPDPWRWDWPVTADAHGIAELAQRYEGGEGFKIAKQAFGSSVTRVDCSIYDLDAQTLGTFDFVYIGSLLIHLRDPLRALENVRSLCKPDGHLLVVDNVDLPLTFLLPRRPVAYVGPGGFWFKPNVAGIRRMLSSTGFAVVDRPRRFYMPRGGGHQMLPLHPKRLMTRNGREDLVTRWRGDPHAALLASPVPGDWRDSRPDSR
jgi:tRNA (mo5U34)-methyltransferase